MPRWAEIFVTIAAISLFFIGAATVALHIWDRQRFPSPESLETDILIGLSLLTLFGLYFPWQRIKFGDWEIERERIEENLIEREIEYADLISNTSSQVLGGDDGMLENARKDKTESAIAKPVAGSPLFSQASKDAVLDFFKTWSTWGFTPKRILNWGANQPGHTRLKSLSGAELRNILPILVKEGQLRIRAVSYTHLTLPTKA